MGGCIAMQRPHLHDLFSSAAKDYAKHRPAYPVELFEALEARFKAPGGASALEVLDLGAGTGISSRAWAQRGQRVLALDPNGSMLAQLMAEPDSGPGRLGAVRAAAEALPCADRCFDLIVGHQCFHWFALGPTLEECARVARPGAGVAAIWNTRTESGLAGDYERVMLRHSRSFRSLKGKQETRAELEARIGAGLEVLEFPWADSLSLEVLLGRARSSSYVQHGVQDLAALEAELSQAFEARAVSGSAAFEYVTTALCWPAELGARSG